jgi:hypothetical protein
MGGTCCTTRDRDRDGLDLDTSIFFTFLTSSSHLTTKYAYLICDRGLEIYRQAAAARRSALALERVGFRDLQDHDVPSDRLRDRAYPDAQLENLRPSAIPPG